MPMRENDKSPIATNNRSIATSSCPNTAMSTANSLANHSPQIKSNTDDNVQIVIELNNCNNPKDGQEGFHEDSQANGVGIVYLEWKCTCSIINPILLNIFVMLYYKFF